MTPLGFIRDVLTDPGFWLVVSFPLALGVWGYWPRWRRRWRRWRRRHHAWIV